jgi:hypothetical protein
MGKEGLTSYFIMQSKHMNIQTLPSQHLFRKYYFTYACPA